jgi:hypothetical protein
MIEERSIYHNVDTINTFPTKKKEFVNGVLGLGFMGNQTRLVLIFFFRNSNLVTTIYLLFIIISLKL